MFIIAIVLSVTLAKKRRKTRTRDFLAFFGLKDVKKPGERTGPKIQASQGINKPGGDLEDQADSDSVVCKNGWFEIVDVNLYPIRTKGSCEVFSRNSNPNNYKMEWQTDMCCATEGEAKESKIPVQGKGYLDTGNGQYCDEERDNETEIVHLNGSPISAKECNEINLPGFTAIFNSFVCCVAPNRKKRTARNKRKVQRKNRRAYRKRK